MSEFAPDTTIPLTRSIVTTSLAVTGEMTARAQSLALECGAPCVSRAKMGLAELLETHSAGRAVVVESRGIALVHRDGAVYRYHPNLGFVRALNLLRGQPDHFIEACDLRPGERVLDCTAGFCSEAMLAAIAVGSNGAVVALESSPELAIATREGLRERALVQPLLQEALRRIELINADYREYLNSAKPGQFDVICFDPFFEARTRGSGVNIDPLLAFGDASPLNERSVLRAIEIAGRRVVLKHPNKAILAQNLMERRSREVRGRHSATSYSVFDCDRPNIIASGP